VLLGLHITGVPVCGGCRIVQVDLNRALADVLVAMDEQDVPTVDNSASSLFSSAWYKAALCTAGRGNEFVESKQVAATPHVGDIALEELEGLLEEGGSERLLHAPRWSM